MNLENGANLKLDRSLVPPTLHDLIPLVERWGFSSDYDQGDFVDLVKEFNPDEILMFNEQILNARHDIRNWGLSLDQLDKHKSQLTDDDWNHPFWAFLSCIKIYENWTYIPTRSSQDSESSKLADLKRRKHDAVLSAVELFRQKDYARVVELLEPFEELLTKVEKAKLNFSKKRLNMR